MTEYTLNAQTPLNGFSLEKDGVSFKEVSLVGMISIAPLTGQEEALHKALKDSFDLGLPKVNKKTLSNSASIYCVAKDQFFLEVGEDQISKLNDFMKDNASLAAMTDQTDSWVNVEASGPNVIGKFERLSMLDIHPDHFEVGSVARTVMEHVGVIFSREANQSNGNLTYRVMAARSFAKSLEHALSI
ncbi:sarcosine oxidase subunit gamma [Curvivirga sp.]|uniref:sarcosine oxidase subunit gamma n=1 Tax=Curvivirga sp. TaxID=2856848 RepID=UPI003B5908C7